MPIVSSCPKCDAPVLVPDGIDPAAKAKCPLCEEQFELQETLSSLPPMLEIVDQPNRPSRPMTGAAPAAAPAAAPSEDGGMFEELTSGDGESSDSDGSIFEFEGGGDSAGEGFGGLDLGGGDTAAEEGGVALDTPMGAAPVSLAGKARPKKAGPGALVQIAGIAGFGVVGLLIGYTIILMIKGAAGDFLGIRQYFPSFLVASSGSSDSPPEVVDKSNNGSKKNSSNKKKNNGNGNVKRPEGGELAPLPFDFDDPTKKGKNNRNKNKNGKGKPKPKDEPKRDPVGPTALEQKLRFNIEDALDEVAVKATTLVAEQEKEAANPTENPDGGLTDLDRADRDHYFALAHLGLTLASAKQGSLDNADELKKRIRQYAHNAVANVSTADSIGEKATRWFDYEEELDDDGNTVKRGRQGRDGILIAGTVRRANATTENLGVFTAQVEIAGSGKMVTIVGAGTRMPAAQQPILLLGAIIADPAENLAGYSGDEDKVIWMAFKVEPPAEDQPSSEDEEEIVGDAVDGDEEEILDEPEFDSIKLDEPGVPLPTNPGLPGF